MKKIKITEKQYKKLLENLSNDGPIVKGGMNRVDKQFVKTTNNSDIETLKPSDMPDSQDIHEDDFNIKEPLAAQAGLPTVPNTRMKKRPELNPMNEDIFSQEVHQAIHDLIQNIWMNPSQRGLDRFFVENGINWGDIISYLTSVGVLATTAAGIYKIKNIFGKKFSEDKTIKMKEKELEIEKIVKKIEKDPKAPWNKETTFQWKQRMQAKPESGWEAKPKPFNSNRFKPGLEETEDDEYTSNYYDDLGKKGQEPVLTRSKKPQIFKPIHMNYDILLADGPDGKYIFYYEDIDRNEFPNPDYELDIDDVSDYLNDNYQKMKTGEGVQGWESGTDNLIKLDDELKELLISLYSKDIRLIKALQEIKEMTSASASGSFVGKAGGGFSSGSISPGNTPASQIEKIINDEDKIYGSKIDEDVNEITTGGFGYVQPAIWAKDEANWAGNKKTQYPKGQFVSFDPCTKLNNNKEAQKGKCSQGAVDKVVKLRTTKDSVISKNIYEMVAKKTGKTVEEVKNIIEFKVNNQSL